MKKLAMIGCGGIGKYHLNHLLNFKDINLAGFCDFVPERANDFVSIANSGKAYTDYKKMYDDINPDMVFICVPPAAHGKIEFETIARKIPFFIEKPIALSVELAEQISAEIKKANLITAVGFQCRYSNLVHPNIKFVKDNQVIFVDCTRIGGVPDVPWWVKRSTSGGQIVEQTIHQLDIIRYVFDEPDVVFTLGTKGFITNIEGFDTEDLSTTVVKFKNGALATISTGCYATSGDAADNKITFSSKDKRAELRILDKFKIIGHKDDEKEGTGSVEASDTGDEKEGFVIKGDGRFSSSGRKEIEYKEKEDAGILCDRTFIDGVIVGDGSKIRSSYEDGLRTLKFALACNQSMDTGLPVKIKY